MKIYVASSWRCKYQPPVVKALLKTGHEVYDFRYPPGKSGFKWSEIDPNWQLWTPLKFSNALDYPAVVNGFSADYAAMCWADVCVLVLPSGRSAHLEAGWFAGRRKPVIVFMPCACEPELMYRLLNRPICRSIKQLTSVLREVDYK
mgnify:CR=1 FL=1